MSEREPHVDLGGYLLDGLPEDERAAIDAHLATCAHCRDELGALRPVAASLDAAMRGPQPPPDLEERVLAAVARAAAADRGVSRAPSALARPWRARRGWAAGLVAGVAVAGIAGAFVVGGRVLDGDAAPASAGTLELTASLSGSGGEASVQVRKVEVGRIVHLRSAALPILPKGQFYQVWFVAPEDRPGAGRRISAGTFHPDERGRVDATFTAAADPALFPMISISRQTGPRAKRPGPEVLRTLAP